MRIIDPSRVHRSEFHFAMEWNKIEYTQRHILNYNTIIDWTVRYFLSGIRFLLLKILISQNDELDRCLEKAIRFNAVSFVELLFEFGASLQRLALIDKPGVFQLKVID